MIGLALDPARMEAIAESLRKQIPNASTDVARPMIDAAAELQRIADEGKALLAKQLEMFKQLASDVCLCANCQARRAAAEKPEPGSLN